MGPAAYEGAARVRARVRVRVRVRLRVRVKVKVTHHDTGECVQGTARGAPPPA